MSIITYLTNEGKRGQAITLVQLQLFLEGNPDSTLKNFFRRPFLQKPSGIAGNTMEENTPASVAATITSSCSMNTYPGTTISSNNRGRGTEGENWFRGYKRGNLGFHPGHLYHQTHRARGPRHPATFHFLDNKQERTNFNSLDTLKETL